jgi:predicted nucleic-acid-binding protein
MEPNGGPRQKMAEENSQLTPELMTESELIEFLRIPELSKSKDHHNVIENLKRMHQLPRIHICGKPLYPREAVREWIKRKTTFAEQPLAR